MTPFSPWTMTGMVERQGCAGVMHALKARLHAYSKGKAGMCRHDACFKGKYGKGKAGNAGMCWRDACVEGKAACIFQRQGRHVLVTQACAGVVHALKARAHAYFKGKAGMCWCDACTEGLAACMYNKGNTGMCWHSACVGVGM
eukprot:1158672-Pelagomonas_calceolata.AAC.18